MARATKGLQPVILLQNRGKLTLVSTYQSAFPLSLLGEL